MRMAIVLRLFALVAVLMLPLGMAVAPAEVHHPPMAMDMPMQHCPDEPSKDDSGGVLAECTMACSAALPATAPAATLAPFATTPADAAIPALLASVEPEIATPPPKLS